MPDRGSGGESLKKALAIFLMGATCWVPSLVAPRGSRAEDLRALAASLPRRLGPFESPQPDRFYDRESIFDYIDGAGEVYLAYRFRECLSRQYVAPGERPLVLDLFDMGSSPDAFGVFTHDREGDPAPFGQDGLAGEGWIRFWKGRYFVSIFLERETDAARDAAHRLAGEVDARIAETGERPRLLRYLPANGLQPDSVRYLHHPVLLDSQYPVGDGNPLGITPETGVLLASYLREGTRAKMLIVSYPEGGMAAEALDRFLAGRLSGARPGEPVSREAGIWSVAARTGNLLWIVPEAESRTLAEEILREASSLGGDPSGNGRSVP